MRRNDFSKGQGVNRATDKFTRRINSDLNSDGFMENISRNFCGNLSTGPVKLIVRGAEG